MMTRIEVAALGYAGAALPVIPLHDRAKEPRIRQWPQRASCDPAVLQRWFGRWPDSNIGLVTGRGFFAIDVDPDRGGEKSFRGLTRGRKWPVTAEARTGSGGTHYLFRTPVPLGNRVAMLPGLDVKGVGGYIVVEPSIHPVSGREYCWLRSPCSFEIAPAPGWLLAMLTGDRMPVAAKGGAQHPQGQRRGDVGSLAEQVIDRWVILSVGTRNTVMIQVIASLFSRGYADETIHEVVCCWWNHYYELGRVRTHPSHAAIQVDKSLGSLRNSETFQFRGNLGHRALCSAITLNQTQIDLMGSTVIQLLTHFGNRIQESPSRPQTPNSKRVTQIGKRLCEWVDERAFVEAVVVHSMHQRRAESDGKIRMTGDQLREITVDRYPDVRWTNQQLERLKRKYIGRPGKPANRFELLSEVSKGHRRGGQVVGTPSVYMPTGVRVFLEA